MNPIASLARRTWTNPRARLLLGDALLSLVPFAMAGLWVLATKTWPAVDWDDGGGWAIAIFPLWALAARPRRPWRVLLFSSLLFWAPLVVASLLEPPCVFDGDPRHYKCDQSSRDLQALLVPLYAAGASLVVGVGRGADIAVSWLWNRSAYARDLAARVIFGIALALLTLVAPWTASRAAAPCKGSLVVVSRKEKQLEATDLIAHERPTENRSSWGPAKRGDLGPFEIHTRAKDYEMALEDAHSCDGSAVVVGAFPYDLYRDESRGVYILAHGPHEEIAFVQTPPGGLRSLPRQRWRLAGVALAAVCIGLAWRARKRAAQRDEPTEREAGLRKSVLFAAAGVLLLAWIATSQRMLAP